jgi:glycosyltransferase involved in cell wall biosynthesis
MGEVRLAVCSAGEIWGGVEQCILTLTGGLRVTGIDPLVVLLYEGLLAERLRQSGARVEVIADCGKYDPRMIMRTAELLRRHRINVLHVHGYKAAVAGALAARRCGIKVVKTEHGRLEPAGSWADAWRQARLSLNTALDGVASRWLVDAQVFVSRDLREGAPAAPARVVRRQIYNGIAPSEHGPGAPAGNDRSSAWFDVGIVGRLTRVKGHADLLTAVAHLGHLPDLRLHVFGSGPLDGACRRQAERLGIASRVLFHGFTPRVSERIAALDVLAMPSWHEGLPYVLLEAMSLNVPVVASSVGGLREVMEGRECGLLVPARDPAGLAAAIERLYRNPGLRAELAARARAVVTRQFAASSMVEQYSALYETVLSPP